MKLVFAICGAAVIAAPVAAKELSPNRSEEILANGEVIWSNEKAGMVIRLGDEVYICSVQKIGVRASLRCWDDER